ncbi:MAG: DUF3292 domain-containing protein [Candidatus Accumulibacter sp.]|jgi:hypothetical protein|nr:DUF3292 domain-containing protein [Accumulibacter sp.]
MWIPVEALKHTANDGALPSEKPLYAPVGPVGDFPGRRRGAAYFSGENAHGQSGAHTETPRDEKRRANDRRKRNLPVLLDTRVGERRRVSGRFNVDCEA